MKHGRFTRWQARQFILTMWSIRAAPLGLLLIAIASAAQLPAIPAIAICVVVLVSSWHLHRYHLFNLGMVSLHALHARRRTPPERDQKKP